MKKTNWQNIIRELQLSEPTDHPIITNRILGTYGKKEATKICILLGGMNGNDQNSIVAIRQFFLLLEKEQPTFNGLLVGLAANMMALYQHQSHINEDLNQIWSAENIFQLQQIPAHLHKSNESVELIQLLRIFQQYEHFQRENFLFIDLRTTISSGISYSMMNQNILSEYYASKLPIPLIKYQTDMLKGTSISYFDQQHLPAITLQINLPTQSQILVAVQAKVLNLLYHLNILEQSFYNKHQDSLSTKATPEQMKLKSEYSYHRPTDKPFQWLTHLTNFTKIVAGDLLATDADGPIIAPIDGYLFTPEHQLNQAFYILKEV
jgi:succinylglutamate desuccinylase